MVQDKGQEEKKPAGGRDKTPYPSKEVGHTVKFTFHNATHLPVGDVDSLSSDPFVYATVTSSLPKRHRQDPDTCFRSHTVRRSCTPEWNAEWIVANIPSDGFKLKVQVFDEDPGNHDDQLGTVEVHADKIDGFSIQKKEYKMKRKGASNRAYFMRGCRQLLSPSIPSHARMYLSVEVLGQTTGEGGRLYTLRPNNWSKHYSPLFGQLTKTKAGEGREKRHFDFEANQFQLGGPVPGDMYHRYVEFKPFVGGMFRTRGVRGWLLHRLLHHQHTKVYAYDRKTRYGCVEEPSLEMTHQFLKMVDYDQGNRIFTYVLTLDGQWRFTETGKQFGIDFLSKHTMHSDVSIYIAFSGEFFIQRRRRNRRKSTHAENRDQSSADISTEKLDAKSKPDAGGYELIIDNDSGTYRPDASILPQLRKYMEGNLVGLRVRTLDCGEDKDEMNRLKDRKRGQTTKQSGKTQYVQASDSSSMSSSDGEEAGSDHFHKPKAPKEKLLSWAEKEN